MSEKAKITAVVPMPSTNWKGQDIQKRWCTLEDGRTGTVSVWAGDVDVKAGDEIEFDIKEFNGSIEFKRVKPGGFKASGGGGFRKPIEVDAAIISSGIIKSLVEAGEIKKDEVLEWSIRLHKVYLEICQGKDPLPW